MEEISWIQKPLFLVGAERSGTTLLRLMLNSHPKIKWCGEFEFVVDLVTEKGQWPDLECYYKWLETHRIFLKQNFLIDPKLDYPSLVKSFLDQERHRTNKLFVGATVHRHFDHLLRIWSGARFVHIVRDPRDVARSCIARGWAGNTWVGIDRWLHAEQLWEQLKAQLAPDQYCEVQYEALVKDPESVLSRLCEFIGTPYDSAMLRYPEYTTYSAPDTSAIYQWKKKMKAREVQLVEAQAAKLLVKRGYELSGLPLVKVSALEKLMLHLQNRWLCAQFRLKRFGGSLFLSDFLSRRLGLKKWQKHVRLKLNQIEQARLK